MGIKNIRESEKENKRRVILSIVKVAILLLIVVGIPAYLYFFQLDWLKTFKDIEDVVAFLERYQKESVLVYIGFQIIQVVISVIPGQVFQMAAGYFFDFWPALLYAATGAFLGTAISFGLAKVLGRDFLHIFFGEEKMSYYIERLNSKQAYIVVFFLYLIPGIPKDMVSYAAGVSEIRFKAFILLSTVGRLPGMIGCLLLGTMAESENYTGMIVLGIVAILGFLGCIIFRKKINGFLDRLYQNISG